MTEARSRLLAEHFLSFLRREGLATPAPWKIGGMPHEQWGTVRDLKNKPVASTCMEAQVPGGFDAFRRDVPFGTAEFDRGPELIASNAELIVEARNHYKHLANFALGLLAMRLFLGERVPFVENMLDELADSFEVPKV